ncbi:GNAT family N-acyltransferase [Octadecabacter sp. 1_MG-2023]|uniref:GNAT family N-acetyltransferase n=1 Tax=unclassified Octadecabacter TaxID=196158 RepID=UPI001C097392|nr:MULTISPECIES: GNAT family N-acyltransferase [unclassified Octadecabacter]MBU2993350.1 GNAT family N-acetyltransferase [Octadecabacter sp. B2R22]MDO6733194.1 GNAT family N-acyltransferase [Octadecabacter sp. 1_MG-2023]
MTETTPVFQTRLAESDDDIRAAQALRYRVFVSELGGDGPLVDHRAALERDRFDDFAEQLILLDVARPVREQVVGVYRFMDECAAKAAGQFYSENEYDLTPLKVSGRSLLEMGRSCLHPDYRGGAAMVHLWQGLAQVVQAKGAEILFGVASFHGQDVQALAQPLSLLARDHLAPDDLRVRASPYQSMQLAAEIDRVGAMKQVPALIKAYLRLGGFVGDGVFIDRQFNTTDVCLVLDVARMNARQSAIYGVRPERGRL